MQSSTILLPQSDLPLVVVIGAGFGGIELVRYLPSDRFRVLLIDRNNYHTFQPLLYQVAIGGLEPDSVAYPVRKIFSGRKNFYFRLTEVTGIDLKTKQVSTSIGVTGYDYLVIATGSKANFFGMDDVKNNSISLKSVTDALDLRSLVLQNLEAALLTDNIQDREALLTMAVVGGGPTGLETAGALAELTKHVFYKDYPELDTGKMKVWLIEAGSELLGAMSARSQKASGKFIRDLGVHLLLNVSVKKYDGYTIVLSNGETIDCRTVIWSAGVTGNILPSFPPELTEKGRIKTDDCNRVIGAENCFALGDVAGLTSAGLPRGYPMLAPVAKQQGKQLAKNLVAIQDGKAPVPFHYTDKGTMATIGRAKAVLDFKKFHLHGFLAWTGWLFIHLMYLVGFRNKIIVLVNWMWNYIRYDSAIRLIIRPYRKPR